MALIPRPTRHPVLRSWPWTIALAAILAGFVLVGMFAAAVRTSTFGIILALLVMLASLFGLYRVLMSGVHVLPSGLLIRELTRTTPVPWARIRSIETASTGRRGVFAPVLVVALEPGPGKPGAGTGKPGAGKAGAGRSGSGRNGGQERMEVTVLASYREDVAQRRTAELVAARAAATGRTRRS